MIFVRMLRASSKAPERHEEVDERLGHGGVVGALVERGLVVGLGGLDVEVLLAERAEGHPHPRRGGPVLATLVDLLQLAEDGREVVGRGVPAAQGDEGVEGVDVVGRSSRAMTKFSAAPRKSSVSRATTPRLR